MKKLLLVEDDAYSAQSLAESLAETYEVLANRTGEEGLAEAVKNIPDVVLLDIMLPGKMNGFDVLRELKNNPKTEHIPVVMLTNLDNQKTTAVAEGAVDCLLKANVSLDEVKAVIEKALHPAQPSTT